MEVDAKLMSSDTLAVWAMAASLPAHVAVGIGAGSVYFNAIRWNARLLAQGGRAGTGIALIIVRIVLLGSLLTLASREGAMPLLALALGVLIARAVVVRRYWEATS
jgi:F1F0 ATPase subunit 2